ncbi:MAG TPA: rhomboid family intramembrane serine protease [Steroidobacteraceae bacterium]
MVTATLIALILAASLLGMRSGRFLDWAVLRPYFIARRMRYWGLITSGFVHADVGHLLFNLITFYSFGFALERAIGAEAFAILYLIGLLASGVGTTLKHRDDPQYASLGASGAILAVLFACILYFPRQRLTILPIPIGIPAPWFAIGYLALTYYWSRQPRGRINHDAHLSGALAGLAFVAVTDPQRYGLFLHALA